jgi:hypothetical protein
MATDSSIVTELIIDDMRAIISQTLTECGIVGEEKAKIIYKLNRHIKDEYRHMLKKTSNRMNG